MPITLHTSLEKSKGQLKTLAEFKASLPSDRMYFRYPEVVDVEADLGSEHFRLKEHEVRSAWEGKRQAIDDAVAETLRENGISANPDVGCYLVTLGPYGYYDEPNEVFVNIWDASADSVVETAVHEFLHLALSEKTAGLSYEDTERFIDSQFKRGLLAETFPDYTVQTF